MDFGYVILRACAFVKTATSQVMVYVHLSTPYTQAYGAMRGDRMPRERLKEDEISRNSRSSLNSKSYGNLVALTLHYCIKIHEHHFDPNLCNCR